MAHYKWKKRWCECDFCSALNRLDCERRLRQDAEDKVEQLCTKLNFDTRLHEQVLQFHFSSPVAFLYETVVTFEFVR